MCPKLGDPKFLVKKTELNKFVVKKNVLPKSVGPKFCDKKMRPVTVSRPRLYAQTPLIQNFCGTEFA